MNQGDIVLITGGNPINIGHLDVIQIIHSGGIFLAENGMYDEDKIAVQCTANRIRAASHYLSGLDTAIDVHNALNHLEALEDEDDCEILFWEPFEHYTVDSILNHIRDLEQTFDDIVRQTKRQVKKTLVSMALKDTLPTDFNNLQL